VSGGRTARAAVLHAAGEPLKIQEITLFDPAPNQVIVRLFASGVCHSDLSVIRGTFPFMFPTVLGHEGSGVIESVGSAVTRVEPGDHVVLTWMPPCRQCPACLAGQNVLCDGSNISPVALNILNIKLPNGQYYIPGSGTSGYRQTTFTSPAIYNGDQGLFNFDDWQHLSGRR